MFSYLKYTPTAIFCQLFSRPIVYLPRIGSEFYPQRPAVHSLYSFFSAVTFLLFYSRGYSKQLTEETFQPVEEIKRLRKKIYGTRKKISGSGRKYTAQGRKFTAPEENIRRQEENLRLRKKIYGARKKISGSGKRFTAPGRKFSARVIFCLTTFPTFPIHRF
jgi:hypothetical protein